VSFPLLDLVLFGPFLLDLVSPPCFVDALPDSYDLFLLEVRSASSITISYLTLFRSAPGSPLPARRSRAGRAKGSGGEARQRRARGRAREVASRRSGALRQASGRRAKSGARSRASGGREI
jgi:hypothetical protein